MAKHGTPPCAVVGYCFGEYAAAIVSGAITEEIAIRIIVQRALGLRMVSGAMLNVFTEVSHIQHCLARPDGPPEHCHLRWTDSYRLVRKSAPNSDRTGRVLSEKHQDGSRQRQRALSL